ncbi:MAG: hypothetical protein WC758_07775 [Candidatus Woesearchaeota archaeon]|jgi:hypothetical protein
MVFKKGNVPVSKRLDILENSKEIIKFYSEDLMSCKEIGKLFKCSEGPIFNVLKENNALMSLSDRRKVLINRGKINFYNKIESLKDNSGEILRLYNEEFKNPSQIGKLFGCSEGPIYEILRENKSIKNQSERKKLLSKNGVIKGWNIGLTKETDERIKNLADSLRGKPKSEEHKQKLKESWDYNKHFTEQIRKNMSLAHIGKKQYEMTDEIRDNISKSNMGQHHSPKTEFSKGHIPTSGFKKGQISLMKDKTYEEIYGSERAKEIALKDSETKKRKFENEDYKEKYLLNNKGVFQKGRNKNKTYEEIFGSENALKMKKGIKERWEDPVYKEKTVKAILKGLMIRPTSYEKKISDLCIENSLPFVYTGNGAFLINFKNPDFVNEKDKVVIEVFYSWFKIRDYGSVENYKEFCKKKYNPSGWKVIFIYETEVDVDNWKELCLNKILEVKN